ncbi:insulinoma-associated protein 1-like [Homarus americanus]|uniref:Insulinoma-associated protein 1a-like n=1 Tax=Homarus americanus TaxID=6706 RepID=A0A8J5MUI4_HOMAM|nr:insulinoma-associated protein 1-like [Homarus americanus]KAG7163474.1 Insulinoma-associated protein 1a-like [Homarus americanus]
MPKGFLVKRREDMSALDLVPYRPWRDAHLPAEQEEPVDFSLRRRRDREAKPQEDLHQVRGDEYVEVVKEAVAHVRGVAEKGSRLLVRTPDSGFSSPSDGDFYRRSVCHTPSARLPPKLQAEAVIPCEVVEQTTPLALIKRKSYEDDLATSLHVTTVHHPPDPNHFQPFQLTIPRLDDPRYMIPPQTSPYHLLSPTLYWPHGSSPLRSPIPFTSPLGRSPYDLSHTAVPLQSPQEGLNLTTRPPGSPRLTTPIKVPPKSPGTSSVATPQKRKSPTTSGTSEKKLKTSKKTKAARRLNFDEDKTSPVSGTIIRELAEGEEPLVVRKGDIDPAYNVVEITEEAKAELAKIDNKIGDYVCRLCKEMYDDAFGLAQHRCSRIIHVEYRCPECDKVFNCPANLASHRRWHKPKTSMTTSTSVPSTSAAPTKCETDANPGKSYTENNNNSSTNNNNLLKGPPALVPLPQFMAMVNEEDNSEEQFECELCFKKFKRQSYLRKHLATHRGEPSNADGAGPSHARQPPALTPLMSPHFPSEVLPCHLCAAAFYTPAALELHLETTHMPKLDPPTTSTPLHVPRPQFSPRGHVPSQPPPPPPPHLLHRPHQISAPT